ncbi:hypothetical protein Tco_0897142 [Tanacetum coccineum]
MPLESPKPPDPILEEFRTLTGMTSSEIHHRPYPCPSIEINLPKASDKPRKSLNRSKGVRIMVESPQSASAGAGSVLKRLRSSKIAGKARIRNEISPVNVNRGKRSNSSTIVVDDVLSKVLDRISYDKGISEEMTFREGTVDSIKKSSIVDKCNSDVKNSGKHMVTNCDIVENDGSFINEPVRSVIVENDEHDIRSDKVECREDFNMVDNTLPTDNVSTHNVADVEHVADSHVRNVDNGVNGDGCNEGGTEFVFGSNYGSKGILNKPTVRLSSVQFGPNLFHKHKSSTAWSYGKFGVKNWNADGYLNIECFAEKMKKGVEDRELQMSYVPQFVSKQENGARRIDISVEDIKKGSEACYLQLYGYFVGTSMDYRIVNANLSRMWRVYGIDGITKTNSGLFYFKFKNEEGMKSVLESGPWMVNNVPLVLNIWEPGIWLEKVEPSTIPIWVCVYNIPMELCNGNGIGKIMTVDELPSSLEIAYPPIGNRPARVGKLDVKYQWKPPLCTFCKTFGHATVSCKVRPRSEEEIAAQTIKEAINVKGKGVNVNGGSIDDDDGFVTVGRKNKPVVAQSNSVQARNGNLFRGGGIAGFQSRSSQSYGRQGNGGGGQSNMFRGNFQQKRNFSQSRSNEAGMGNMKVVQGKLKKESTSLAGNNKQGLNKDKESLVKKPSLASTYNQDFRPKVLVRGSGSNGVSNDPIGKDVPISNSFISLAEAGMVEDDNATEADFDEECELKIWPELQKAVDDIMKAGIYPSKATRMEWSLRQMDYFYGNCHKFKLDPSFEDDDVESETNGTAKEMKSDYMVDDVPEVENEGTFVNNLCGLLETRVKKKKLSGICRRVFGGWDWVSNAHSYDGGTRIIVGWDPRSVNVMVIEKSSQVMHCFVEPINGCDSFHCSFVYANVKTVEKRSLWRSLMKYKCSVGDKPWVVLGDFNVSIDPSEKSSGCSKITTGMCDFRECLANIEVEDIAMTGLHFTWNKRPGKIGGLLKKLDRILGNVQFMASFPNSYANFPPFMKSDHSPAVLVIPEVVKAKPRPFKFHNYLAGKDGFVPIVSNVWNQNVEGYSMFTVVSKLKSLKRPLRKLNADQGNLFDNVKS